MLQKYQRDYYPNLPVSDCALALATGNAINYLRIKFKESGMTYDDLCIKTGISISSLRSYFAFTCVPSLASYIQLSNVLL